MKPETTYEALPDGLEELFKKNYRYNEKLHMYFFPPGAEDNMKKNQLLSDQQRRDLPLLMSKYLDHLNANL